MGEIDEQELTDRAFARRLGELLTETRRADKASCRTLAKRSRGTFDLAQLHEIERGDGALTEELITVVCDLYGADLETILPGRDDVRIGGGVMMVGTAESTYIDGDTTSMLATYLRLVRGLRRQQRVPYVELRRDDVEQLATYVGRPGEWVVDQLATLMGVTRAQQRSMLGLFAGGATVIAVVASLTVGVSVQAAASEAPAPVASIASRITSPGLALPPEGDFIGTMVVTARPAPVTSTRSATVPSPASRPAPTATAPSTTVRRDSPASSVPTAVDDDGALVATDLGTGDSAPVPTAVDDSGALVATDLGTGDAPPAPSSTVSAGRQSESVSV
ncbi:MAG: hypothetical protein JWM12_2689 [Ilumatobacteraceae bacterium]|nr:hypothetical protein [Ilumatobacteraceae bacterium]